MTVAEVKLDTTTQDTIVPADVRKRADLSQDDMASLLGMSPYGYQQWESGQRRPGGPAWRLLHLIDTLGKPAITELRGYTD